MLLTSPTHVNADAHAAIARQVDAFLARGGQIERLPIGAMRDTTARERINPSTPPKPEREARKRAAAVLPRPPEHRPRRDRTPKPPKLARPGSQKARILTELAQGPVSAKFVAGAIGTSRNVVLMQLYDLRERGLVWPEGTHHDMRWGLTADGRRMARGCEQVAA
jgi:hypothetical protein